MMGGLAAISLAGCVGGNSDDGGTEGGETGGFPELDVHEFANGCYALESEGSYMAASGQSFGFSAASVDAGASFFMKASDLGTYLFYDADRGYLVSEGDGLERRESLESDITQIDDDFVSGAEWMLETSQAVEGAYWLRNRRTGGLMSASGTTEDTTSALNVHIETTAGCTEHPELTLDAEGEVEKTTFEDGDLYGIVDTHSHILSNFAFGGGGIFHGAPFHRLGVEHALGDCDRFHGEMGRKDFFGYAFDSAGADGADLTAILGDLIAGELAEDNHATEGYPTFTAWPNGPSSSTHQTQYYLWLERAHKAGLRLVVQHATTNSAICHLTAGEGFQEVRYSCEDMVAVDRIIDETFAMERYIDAQSGGPGEGWFRIAYTPQEAREYIEAGKMAVILGIETSDLFNCRLTPREGDEVCDEAYVKSQLDHYYDLGVRAIFPVHKYDNLFSAGDGDRAFIELGNFANTGHWANFTLDCPDEPVVFDKGDVFFGGLNMPREDYLSPAPNDFSNFPTEPLGTLFTHITALGDPPLEGAYCQSTGLTALGETLIEEMMDRGMIIEIDHLPQRSYGRAYEMLEAADYPAASTHGSTNDGRIYDIGGISKTGLGRCRSATEPGAMVQRLKDRIALIEEHGGYPAEGFGFDLNGFAGAPGPRMAEGACADPQTDPITYPFTSMAGDVEFTQPYVGDREIDFNQEGLVHIGMLPELLEDARGDAESDADLEPLFRSAEGYIRMWELAEARAAAR